METNSNSVIMANEVISEVPKSNTMYFKVSQISDRLSKVVFTLSDIQKRALWIIVTSNTPRKDLSILADTIMSMPEVLIDEINDIASEYLDDILIGVFDDAPYILDQYEQELKESAMEVTL